MFFAAKKTNKNIEHHVELANSSLDQQGIYTHYSFTTHLHIYVHKTFHNVTLMCIPSLSVTICDSNELCYKSLWCDKCSCYGNSSTSPY